VIGWLLDTNVIGTIINPNGAPTVKAWAAGQDESRFFLSILTLAEYDKGIHNVPDDHPNRLRFIAVRDALAARFVGRILSIGDDRATLGRHLRNDETGNRPFAAGDRYALGRRCARI
jgi:toxin FitB